MHSHISVLFIVIACFRHAYAWPNNLGAFNDELSKSEQWQQRGRQQELSVVLDEASQVKWGTGDGTTFSRQVLLVAEPSGEKSPAQRSRSRGYSALQDQRGEEAVFASTLTKELALQRISKRSTKPAQKRSIPNGKHNPLAKRVVPLKKLTLSQLLEVRKAAMEVVTRLEKTKLGDLRLYCEIICILVSEHNPVLVQPANFCVSSSLVTTSANQCVSCSRSTSSNTTYPRNPRVTVTNSATTMTITSTTIKKFSGRSTPSSAIMCSMNSKRVKNPPPMLLSNITI